MVPRSPDMEPVKAACALLDAGAARGTGFLVSAEHLLTCHHVVKDAAPGPIFARFTHGCYQATIELLDAENDCALLRLERPVPPDAARPLILAGGLPGRGALVDGYGFPAVTGQAGLLIDGCVQDPTGQDPLLRPAVVLRSASVTAGSWLQGFSGSPVLAGGVVIGQMRQIIPDASGGAQLAVIYACPARALRELTRHCPGASALVASEAPPLPVGTELPRAVFYVPQRLMPHFTGRDRLLARLHTQLAEHRLVALWGLGGLGKTQSAVAYAIQQRDAYAAVLWVAGDSIASFEQGLLELWQPLAQAGQLRESALDGRDPAKVRQQVLTYLRTATDYLLICDNVDAPLTLRPVWPRSFAGQVLITSRSQDVRRLVGGVVELEKLPHAESCRYLSACHPPQGADEHAALAELAQELDGLPLALAQAAAFLVEHQSRYADYLRQYRKQQLGLLEQGLPPLEEYPHSVATTWTMSIEQVERAGGAADERSSGRMSALDLLKLCAFLYPDAIPEPLLAAALPADGDALALDHLLKPLLSHALLQRDRENRVLSIHRLVQQALRYRMAESEQRRWAQTAWTQLARVFPFAEYSSWPLCRKLLPQVEALLTYLDRFALADRGIARCLDQAAYYLMVQGQLDEAEPLYRRSLTIHQTAQGDDHPEFALSLNSLARFLRHRGDFAAGEALCRRALAIQERMLSSDHPDLTVSLNNLGKLLYKQGKFAEAEPHLRRALATRERLFGATHLQVATIQQNLGTLLRESGRQAEAEPLLRRALAVREELHGSEHWDVATSRYQLGLLLHALGQLDEAENLLRRALSFREHALPADHHLIARTRSELAALLTDKARREPAARS